MDFPPDHYFETATERMRQAQFLFHVGESYALSIYVGGVAVECMLRAFKGRRDPTFDERHDLIRLFAASRMIDVDPVKLRARHWTEDKIDAHRRALQAAVNDVVRLWANNYRYASERRLLAHLKQITGYRKIKGDYLRALARQFLNSAQTFVDMGAMQWHV
jgi:hypothetical protein